MRPGPCHLGPSAFRYMMRSPALNSTFIGPDCRKRARASRAEQSCRTKAFMDSSLSNELILHRGDTCCRRHFHRGCALNTTRSHDQRQIMLEYAAVTLAPAYLLGSLDTCCPQVSPRCGEYLCKHSSVMYSTVTCDTNWPAGPGNPARRELGRAFTRRWCSSSWSDHDNNMEQRAVAHG